MHPLPLASRRYDAGAAQIRQMARDLGLRASQNLNEITHTYLLFAHKVQEPQPSVVAEGLKETFHVKLLCHRHTSNTYDVNEAAASVKVYAIKAACNDTGSLLRPNVLPTCQMKHYNVLFLCTGNSARSIMAEAIMNHKGSPLFTAYSAGSHPTGTVRPEALHQIAKAGLSTEGYRSKSWAEFSKPDSLSLEFIFTVCDTAAKELCPLWPGHPITAHWGIPDPAAFQGTAEEVERAFGQAYATLDRRISLFLSLPLATLDTFSLRKEIDNIGKQ